VSTDGTDLHSGSIRGGLAAFAGSDAQLQTELFEQRRVDFMLARFRMFDVIRYKRQYGLDLWPKGKLGGFLANDYSQSYGTTECWPIGVTEKAANINIP
jgi:hypothetical protein